MAIAYTLHDHDGQLVGEHTVETRLTVGEVIPHEDRSFLVVAVPPPPGTTFIDPLFDGYALEVPT
jgi:hypothetical protein